MIRIPTATQFLSTILLLGLNNTGTVTATSSFSAYGLVSRREGSTSVFYSFDSEGNVSQRSDSTGSVLSDYLFDSHGAAKNGSVNEPFGYKAQFGYYTDPETGLQLLTHRYYDPNTGRFLTRDPIGHGGGINLYSYVMNNPLSWIDVEGTQKKPTATQPPDDVYRRALEKIAGAVGATMDPDWTIRPGSKSYGDAIRDLKRMGFTPFFNPNRPHWGGSDWEGQIDGNWYHVTLGYPNPGDGAKRRRFDPGIGPILPTNDCTMPVTFVTAHWERYTPSSAGHLIDYLSPSIAPLIPLILSEIY
ncbi:MAG TPA: RHS repeat-associated core domain-containing protein [Pyrinomonadaceae bacterium]|nr:RHS repeat-associated core domain-containing protein [Pyrinomonadaceae bacterium]